jgi:A/G-specific adenine glycosylase
MLQQTQVTTVLDYFALFTGKWPTVEDLARADMEDVLKAWAGLGYYSRARNLKKCADIIARDYKGIFPQDVAELKKLPGIGDYTAAAIAAIGFRSPAAVVDGNIERVITRLFRIDTPLRLAKKQIHSIALELLPSARPGDFAQAMMDLGAGICSPKKPNCALCPVNRFCQGYASGDAELYPVKPVKTAKPVRSGAAFLIQNRQGAVYLQKRPDNGLLGGMSELPGTEWTSRQDGLTGKAAHPFAADWKFAGRAKHTFTHFHLTLEVWHCVLEGEMTGNGWWVPVSDLANEALPTVMKKAITVALPETFKEPLK